LLKGQYHTKVSSFCGEGRKEQIPDRNSANSKLKAWLKGQHHTKLSSFCGKGKEGADTGQKLINLN
jgi:hypothetical protein